MKKNYLILVLLLSFLEVNSQSLKKRYSDFATEVIFSFGEVKAPGISTENIVRFSLFYHFQNQNHYNFNEHFGMYTGLGMRNVGLINDLNDSIRLKQRSYTLGLPIAFKIGNMSKQSYLAIGAEVEWMFAYKQKVFFNDQKVKFSEWFSNRVTPINPSIFAELHSSTGQYIRFKYYLQDFLATGKQKVYINNALYPYNPTQSTLMYVSIGTTIPNYRKMTKRADRGI